MIVIVSWHVCLESGWGNTNKNSATWNLSQAKPTDALLNDQLSLDCNTKEYVWNRCKEDIRNNNNSTRSDKNRFVTG